MPNSVTIWTERGREGGEMGSPVKGKEGVVDVLK